MATKPVPKIMQQGKVTPYYYLAPAILLMLFFIVYPMINTISLSFKDGTGRQSAATTCVEGKPCWGIFENYHYALTAELNTSTFATTWNSFWISSYGNTIKWIIIMVAFTVLIGLVFAKIVDGIKYEALSKAMLFMPMAISFVGAGVIWKFVYSYGSSQLQVGLLNAIITGLGGKPISFLTTPVLNTYMLIIVGVWIWTGFCMTILSSALKSVPD